MYDNGMASAAGPRGRKAASKPARSRRAPRLRRRIGVDGQRELLCEAAAVLFAEQGVENCSVEDVLRRAGVSRQTFYRCYGNKDELFHDVHARVTGAVIQSVTALSDVDEADPARSMRRHFESLFAQAREAGPIICELEREAARPGSPYSVHRDQRRAWGIEYGTAWALRHFGVKADLDLVRGVIYGIEQLALEVAETRSTRVQTANLRAAVAMVEAALLRLGVSRNALGRPH